MRTCKYQAISLRLLSCVGQQAADLMRQGKLVDEHYKKLEKILDNIFSAKNQIHVSPAGMCSGLKMSTRISSLHN